MLLILFLAVDAKKAKQSKNRKLTTADRIGIECHGVASDVSDFQDLIHRGGRFLGTDEIGKAIGCFEVWILWNPFQFRFCSTIHATRAIPIGFADTQPSYRPLSSWNFLLARVMIVWPELTIRWDQ